MRTANNYVLTIAGFDPSGGAGVLADTKTMEAHGVCGMGVCSALTFQNDVEFQQVDWVPVEKIISQIQILQKRFKFRFVKIGLIENLSVLEKVISLLRTCQPAGRLMNSELKIVWDPILKASAGFVFHPEIDRKSVEHICKQLFLITPNWEEIKKIMPGQTEMEAAKNVSRWCNVLLKGGHSSKENADDVLFYEGGKIIFHSERIVSSDKHGTGCVLSSAILANLAKGKELPAACKDAKEYVTQFMLSNDSMLGRHSAAFTAAHPGNKTDVIRQI